MFFSLMSMVARPLKLHFRDLSENEAAIKAALMISYTAKLMMLRFLFMMSVSPIVAGGKIIAASVPGVVTVIQVDDKLKVMARNNFGEKIFATPAVAENKIYLRTTGHLYALGE